MYCFSLNFLSLIYYYFFLFHPCCTHQMLCQNRRRHAADTARNRGCRRSSSFQIGKIHIAAEFSIFIYIDPNVNDNRILFYIGVVDHRCFSHTGSQNIRLPAYLRQTGSSRVADGHGRIFMQKQHRKRASHNHASSYDCHPFARKRDIVHFQHAYHCLRRTRRKTARIAAEHLCDIDWGNTVQILRRIDHFFNILLVDLFWKRA